MGRLEEVNKLVSDKLAQMGLVKDQLKDLKKKAKLAKVQMVRCQKGLALVNEVALETQAQLEYHLSDMVSMGLNTVFDTEYNFRIIFEIRRGKTECDLFFEKKGQLVDPLKFSGLGAADVAAFCLRCAAWSMDKQYRNTLVLDEPFKHLKGERENIRAIQLMKTLSEELNLQIICVNDERASREDIVLNADKTFLVTQNKKGVSKVTEL